MVNAAASPAGGGCRAQRGRWGCASDMQVPRNRTTPPCAPAVRDPPPAGEGEVSALVLATHRARGLPTKATNLVASKNEGRRSAGRRDCPVGPRHAADVAIHLRFGRRPRVQRNALAFRRSTAVLASAICRNSIQAALHTMQREGVTSTLASRLSEAPRAPVVMPAGSMPGPPESGSDEPPPAGTEPTPSVGVTG